MSGHQTRVSNTVNLYSYLRFCGNIICTADLNGSLWLTEATKTDTNDCGMPNDNNFAPFFWTMGGVARPHGGNRKNWKSRSFCSFISFFTPYRNDR